MKKRVLRSLGTRNHVLRPIFTSPLAPEALWKIICEHSTARFSQRRAENDYVHLPAMCLEDGQSRMEVVLTRRLEDGQGLNLDLIRADVGQRERHLEKSRQVKEFHADLSEYDECLSQQIVEMGEPTKREEVLCG